MFTQFEPARQQDSRERAPGLSARVSAAFRDEMQAEMKRALRDFPSAASGPKWLAGARRLAMLRDVKSA